MIPRRCLQPTRQAPHVHHDMPLADLACVVSTRTSRSGGSISTRTFWPGGCVPTSPYLSTQQLLLLRRHSAAYEKKPVWLGGAIRRNVAQACSFNDLGVHCTSEDTAPKSSPERLFVRTDLAASS